MRLFIAVNFPPPLQTDIWRAAAPLRDAEFPVRWVAESELHLTLKFLGETDADQVTGIVTAIERAVNGTRSFSMPIGGFGVFPSVERPRVFWVGCDGVPPLELVQHGLEVGTERMGFPVEGRPFRPHLTLGRAKKDAAARSFRNVGTLLEGLEYQTECFVGSIDLMESKRGPRGSKYQLVHSVPLGPGNE